MKTQTIAKQSITLEKGQRYRASRPFAERGRTSFPIWIKDDDGCITLELEPMSYDEANEFLAAFNNGVTSFEGRVW